MSRKQLAWCRCGGGDDDVSGAAMGDGSSAAVSGDASGSDSSSLRITCIPSQPIYKRKKPLSHSFEMSYHWAGKEMMTMNFKARVRNYSC